MLPMLTSAEHLGVSGDPDAALLTGIVSPMDEVKGVGYLHHLWQPSAPQSFTLAG